MGQLSGATHPPLCSTIPEGQTHPILQARGQIRGGLSLFAQVRGHMVPQVVYTFPLGQAESMRVRESSAKLASSNKPKTNQVSW